MRHWVNQKKRVLVVLAGVILTVVGGYYAQTTKVFDSKQTDSSPNQEKVSLSSTTKESSDTSTVEKKSSTSKQSSIAKPAASSEKKETKESQAPPPATNRTPAENKLKEHTTFVIKSQSDLDQLVYKKDFNLSGMTIYFDNAEQVTFPYRAYPLVKPMMLVSRGKGKGNIDFNNSEFYLSANAEMLFRFYGDGGGRVVRNAVVYGTTTEKLNKGNFISQGFRGSNFTFENLSFINAQNTDNHLFDLANCKNIVFNRINCYGYGDKDYSDDDLKYLYDKRPHMIYSEAIQLDIDTELCFGEPGVDKMAVFKDADFGKLKEQPCEDIQVLNSTFTSLDQSRTGESMITGDKSKVVSRRYGPTGVGSHTGENTKNVTIVNCLFQNTIRVPGLDTDKRIYPVHFRQTGADQIHLDQNQFANTYGRPDFNGGPGTYVAWYQ